MRLLFDKFKLKIWMCIYGSIYSYKYWKCRKLRHSYQILNSEETINYIINKRCSVSRYGDGELAMIYHFLDGGDASNFYINAFQRYSEQLASKLYQVLKSDKSNLLISVPYPISNVDEYVGLDKVFWKRFTILDINRFKSLLSSKQVYGNSCFTRFYLNHKKYDCYNYVQLLKKIWDNLNICIIEGDNSRLGVGNDLFSNAKSIHRILCPTLNAFKKYDKIRQTVYEQYNCFDLYLIALGHTATILASDLADEGLWAIDIGHIDIEYEWYLQNATEKVAIQGKYVNEVLEGRKLTVCDDRGYESQILTCI